MTNSQTLKVKKQTKSNRFSFSVLSKIFLLCVFFALTLFISLTLKNYIGAGTNSDVYLGFARLFDMTNLAIRARNFAILLNFICLYAVIALALFSAYHSFSQGYPIWKTIALNIIYLLLTALAIVFLVLKPINYQTNLKSLLIAPALLLITFIIRFVVNLSEYLIRRKKSPAFGFKNLSPILASAMFLLSAFVGFLLLILLIQNAKIGSNGNSKPNIDDLFNKSNQFYWKLDRAFNTIYSLSYVYLFIIVAYFFVGFVFLLTPYFKQSKQIQKSLFTNLIAFALTFFLAMFVYIWTNIGTLSKITGVVFNLQIQYIAFSVLIGISLILSVGLFAVLKIAKKLKLSNNVFQFIYFIFVVLLLIGSFVVRVLNFDRINNYVAILNLFVFIIAMSITYFVMTPQKFKNWILILILGTFFISLSGFFLVVDLKMIEQDNPILSSVFVVLNISDLFIIFTLVLALVFELIQITKWLRALFIVKKYNKKKQTSEQAKELQYEN